MNIDEMIAVLQAYKEGKAIEFRLRNSLVWCKCNLPVWDWLDYEYRVKPEPRYRPFESAEEVMEAIKEHGDWVRGNGRYYKIVEITDKTILRSNELEPDTLYACLFEYKLTFADGTPFGKLVEE